MIDMRIVIKILFIILLFISNTLAGIVEVYSNSYENIFDCRTGNVILKIVDESGNPIPNLLVDYSQISHDFLFGIGTTRDNKPYYYPDLLYLELKNDGINHALPYLTWKLTSESPDWVDLAYKPKILNEMGYVLIGHCLVWFYDEYSNLPAYVKELSFDELKLEVRSHILNTVGKYKNWINIWMINEPNFEYTNSLHLTEEQWIEICIVATEAIKQADIDGKVLINMLPADIPYINYYPIKFLESLIENNVDFDIIGLQLYGHGRTRNVPLDTNGYPMISWVSERLEDFSKLGRPIFLTEIGVSSNPSKELQAEWLHDLYVMAFSKPYVKSIVWYCIADQPFYPSAGLMEEPELRPKTAFETLKEFISLCTTKGVEKTDAYGIIEFQGYAGKYIISIITPDFETLNKEIYVVEGEEMTYILELARARFPVGGIITPINKLTVIAPYLVLFSLIGVIYCAFAIKRRYKR